MKHTTKPNANLAIGYLRVSTADQNLGAVAQRQQIEQWATKNGVTIVGWHEDHGVSGAAALDKRIGLMAAIDNLAVLGAGTLVVAKRDRLARDVVLSAMIERLVVRHGGRIVSSSGEGSDGDDPASQLMRTMIDAFAQYERQIIKARTKAALAVKKTRGERVGTVPYGYAVGPDSKTLIRNEGEQEVIAQVRQARNSGVPFRAIVAELQAAGVVSRKGRPLGLAQVVNMVAMVAA